MGRSRQQTLYRTTGSDHLPWVELGSWMGSSYCYSSLPPSPYRAWLWTRKLCGTGWLLMPSPGSSCIDYCPVAKLWLVAQASDVSQEICLETWTLRPGTKYGGYSCNKRLPSSCYSTGPLILGLWSDSNLCPSRLCWADDSLVVNI